MASKRLLSLVWLLLVWAAALVFSQEPSPNPFTEDGNTPIGEFLDVTPESPSSGKNENIFSYTKIEDGETVVIQHLSWQGAAHARTYKITLEREGDSGWEMLLQNSTGETFIEFSFPGGVYRYQIQAYDFLNRPAGNTDWHVFSILTALKPEIENFTPGTLQKSGDTPNMITLRGKDFSPEARVFLRDKKTGREIAPLAAMVSRDLQTLNIRFDPAEIPAGSYDICVINPGDLSVETGPLVVRITLSTTIGFTFQAGYAPLAPLYGRVFTIFPGFTPLGLYARAGILPLKTGALDGGVEFSLFWNSLDQNSTEYQARAQLLESRFNLLARYALPIESLVANLRLGGGLVYFLNFNFDDEYGIAGSFGGFYFSAGGDLSLQWFPMKKPPKRASFFVEAGIGYTHVITAKDKTQPGFLRFFAGAGAKY